MEARPHNPEQDRLAHRRRYEARKKMKDHGAAGTPSDLPPLDAIKAGVCPLCSDRTDALHLHFPVHFPGLLREEARLTFLRKLNLPENTDLTSDARRETARLAALRRMHGPDGEAIRENLAERALEQARKGRHYVAPVPYWPIMRLIARGNTVQKVWELLELDGKLMPNSIGKRARDHGFTFGTEGVCDQGEPYRYGRLRHLRGISGFEAADFDKCAGLDGGASYSRSGGTCPEDRIVGPDEALKAIEWRDAVLAALLREDSLTVAGKEYRKDDVLLTFLPEIVETNRALVLTMTDIRRDARKHPGIERLFEEICRAAAFEQSIEGNPDHSRRKTLRYVCEEKSESWLTTNMARLRSIEEDDGPLVRELLGHRYGATEQTIQNTLRPRAKVIARANVWALIKTFAPKSGEPQKHVGRREGLSNETKERIQLAAAFCKCGWSQRKMSIYLYPDKPASAESNAYRFFSDYRKEIGRATSGISTDEAEAVLRRVTHPPSNNS